MVRDCDTKKENRVVGGVEFVCDSDGRRWRNFKKVVSSLICRHDPLEVVVRRNQRPFCHYRITRDPTGLEGGPVVTHGLYINVRNLVNKRSTVLFIKKFKSKPSSSVHQSFFSLTNQGKRRPIRF